MKNPISPVSAPFSRIIAVDFWRGLCLLMIFIDHVPDSPMSMITLHSLGFSDAAEIFVFLSGFSAVLAFSRYFSVGGFLCGTLRVVKRTWQLFCAHVLLVFAGAATFALADTLTNSKTVMEQMNFTPFFVETGTALLRIVKLSYMPNLTDILPIYILFIGMFPFLWLLLRVSPWLALAVSGGVWLWAHIAHFTMPNYPEGMTWFFNPLAWQLIFVLGTIVSFRREQVKRYAGNKFAFFIALCMIIVAFVTVAPWTQIPALSHDRIIRADFMNDNDKHDLSFLRIVHFVAIAIVAYRLLPPNATFWKSRTAYYVSLCGRYALPIYCTGVIAALIVDIYLGTQKPTPFEVSVAQIAGLLFLFMLAFILESGQAILRRAETAKVTAKN